MRAKCRVAKYLLKVTVAVSQKTKKKPQNLHLLVTQWPNAAKETMATIKR